MDSRALFPLFFCGVSLGDERVDFGDERFVFDARQALRLGALDDVAVEAVNLELGARVEIEFCRREVVSVGGESFEDDVVKVFRREGETSGVRNAQDVEHLRVQPIHARSVIGEQTVAVTVADNGEEIGDAVDEILANE